MATHSRIRAGLLALAAAGLFWGARPVAATETLVGEVVDLPCYLLHPEHGMGPSHRKCADVCFKKGLPMGLLTDDKQVFVLLEDHDNPAPYAELKNKAAVKVTVEGNRVANGGTQGLVVETVK